MMRGKDAYNEGIDVRAFFVDAADRVDLQLKTTKATCIRPTDKFTKA